MLSDFSCYAIVGKNQGYFGEIASEFRGEPSLLILRNALSRARVSCLNQVVEIYVLSTRKSTCSPKRRWSSWRLPLWKKRAWISSWTTRERAGFVMMTCWCFAITNSIILVRRDFPYRRIFFMFASRNEGSISRKWRIRELPGFWAWRFARRRKWTDNRARSRRGCSLHFCRSAWKLERLSRERTRSYLEARLSEASSNSRIWYCLHRQVCDGIFSR